MEKEMARVAADWLERNAYRGTFDIHLFTVLLVRELACRMVGQRALILTIACILNLNRNTVYKYLKAHNSESNRKGKDIG